jgi:hypothetical protein
MGTKGRVLMLALFAEGCFSVPGYLWKKRYPTTGLLGETKPTVGLLALTTVYRVWKG